MLNIIVDIFEEIAVSFISFWVDKVFNKFVGKFTSKKSENRANK